MFSGTDRGETTDATAERSARLRTGATGCERKETPPPILLGATHGAAVEFGLRLRSPSATPVGAWQVGHQETDRGRSGDSRSGHNGIQFPSSAGGATPFRVRVRSQVDPNVAVGTTLSLRAYREIT
jgi:hypothetical protein